MEDKQKEFDLEVLKWILGGYFRAEKKLQSLENRLAIISDKKYHAGIAQLSDMPKSPSSDARKAMEDVLLREEKMRLDIERQKAKCLQAMDLTMSMIDFLPNGSRWQEVTELYHIGVPDMYGPMSMVDISEWLSTPVKTIGERQCYRIYEEAIQIILNTPDARFMIHLCRNAYLDYLAAKRRGKKRGRPKK